MGRTQHTIMENNTNNKSNMQRTYGWRRQLPDRRDKVYMHPLLHAPKETKLDLRNEHMPAVYNQGKLGSCTTNAIAAAFEYCEAEQGYGEKFTPSRLFIYYNEREMEGTTGSDSGAEIRDGIKSINKLGVCPETEWPYDDTGDKFTQRPDKQCYRDALKERALKYQKVKQDVKALKHAMATEGKPVVFGFTVYSSFESEEVASTGVMPMPDDDEQVLGGHAVMACGFDDEEEAVLVRNSWGDSWGDSGYFWMPYEFISDPNLADDFWMVDTIDAEKQAPPVDGDQTYSAHFPKLHSKKPAPSPLEYPGTPTELVMCGKFSKTGVECQAGRKTTVMWKSSKVPTVTVQYCVNSWTGMLSSWMTIAEGVENNGCLEWMVPADAAPDTRYWLRVSSAADANVYTDSEYFTVVGDSSSAAVERQ